MGKLCPRGKAAAKRKFQIDNNLNLPTRYFIRLEKYATNPLYAELLMKTYHNIYVIKL